MAEETRCLSVWMEVAPALLISPARICASPSLETIEEEESEEYDD
ncbi:hypothetical protein Pint_35621 [Pistacia integerrima]|uniref:Uncharacterized protein n=1 Tax=Pistacia integerrima TaxID=434235 RepID=A0ACC0Y5U6_9ROSI|nr:hypothetical protein Pint_35621 [Pistacia integerrima]